MDGLVAAIAGRQGGTISARQLRWAGLSRTTIARRAARGRLFHVMHGVYALTPTVGVEGRRWAALLAAGIDRPWAAPGPSHAAGDARSGARARDPGDRRSPGGRGGSGPPTGPSAGSGFRPPRPDGSVVLSHWSALHVAGIVPGEPAVHDVTSVGPRRRASRNARIRGHEADRVASEDLLWRGPMPYVAPARALVDVAGQTTVARLRTLIREAQFRGQLDARRIASLQRRVPSHPGLAALRHADPDLLVDGTSPLEVRVGAFLARETGLAPWESQHEVGPYRVDHARPDLLLAVEADGAGAHVTTQGRAADAVRDAELAAAGWETVRIMRVHLDGPAARQRTAERLRRVAIRRGWRPR